MPFYSSHPAYGRLVNTLRYVLDERGWSSFKLSRASDISPTTTRKIYNDSTYIPSPDVLEKICVTLDIQPGDILQIMPRLEKTVALGLASGVFTTGL